ncbi:MAG TPA: VOC family protein [Steroidobacteraceae bacterium]|nr:VOC family protein [Steroidobacteraceae bacterium]
MFTYICLGTRDLARAARFYDPVMATLGLPRCDVSGEPGWEGVMGWGTYQEHGARELALWVCAPFNGEPATAGNGTMVALAAKSWEQVDAFHAAALSHGGSSEGAPGLRPHYQPDFYAAYVRDPDGNKLAAVCRGFTQRQIRSLGRVS